MRASTPVWDYEIFLSHNSRDKPAVEMLARRLLEARVKPWLDKWDLVPGEDWLPAIEGAMRACPAIAICVGPSGFGKVHSTELQAALNATYADGGKRVLPILLPGAAEGGADVPEFLKLKTWIDFRREDDEAFGRLVNAVRGERPGAIAPDTSECPYRGLEPFRAEHARFFYGREGDVAGLLESLANGDHILFLVGASGSGKSSLVLAGVVPAVVSGQLDGSYRWRVVSLKPGSDPCRSLARALLEVHAQDATAAPGTRDALIGRVRGEAGGEGEGERQVGLLALQASGSLLEIAGELEKRSPEIKDFDQGRTLLARLERAVQRTLAEIDSATGTTADLARELSRVDQLRDMFLHRIEAFADGVAASLPHETKLLLIVDQFEEIFTLVQDPVLRSAFLKAILHAAHSPGSRVHVIITARADFLGKFLADPLIAPIVQASMRVALAVMSREQLERSIRGPAGQVGLQVEDAVVDALVEGVAGEPGDLPLLQFTLYELWRRREGRKITWEAYTDMGGLKGAIAKRAEDVFEELGRGDAGAADQLTLRRICGRLVQLGEGTEDTRRRASHEELRAVDPRRSESLIERLVAARLLSASEHDVEVVHEAVIREWGRLRGWIDEDREALRLRQELDRAEKLWSESGHENTDLWRGGRLERARELHSSGDLILAERELAFLRASAAAVAARQQQEEEQRARELQAAQDLAAARGRSTHRLRIGVVIVSVLGLVAFVLGGLAYDALKSARSRQIAFASETVEEADGMLSMLLAIQAVKTAPTPDAIKELYDSLTRSHERLVVEHPMTVSYAAWNARGDRILTYCIDKQARLWRYDETDIKATRPLPTEWRKVKNASWDPDGEFHKIENASWDSGGNRVLLLFDDGTMRVADEDGELVEDAQVDVEDRQALERPVSMAASNGQEVPEDPRWPEALRKQIEASILAAKGPRKPVQYIAGHLGRVTRVSFLPPDDLQAPTAVLTVSQDNTGRIWSDDGHQRAVLRGHSGSVLYGAWHPGGKHVITASMDTTVRIWEIDVLRDSTLPTPEPAKAARAGERIPPEDPDWTPTFTRWSPDGKLVLQADDDGQIRLYREDDRDQADYLRLVGHQEKLMDADWHGKGDSTKVLTTSFDQTARVWGISEAEAEAELVLRGHRTSVHKGRWHPNGDKVLTVSDGGTARIWNLDGQSIALLGARSDKVKDAYWSTDEKGQTMVEVIYREGGPRAWPGTIESLLEAAETRRSWTLDERAQQAEPRILTEDERQLYICPTDRLHRAEASTMRRLMMKVESAICTALSTAVSSDGTPETGVRD